MPFFAHSRRSGWLFGPSSGLPTYYLGGFNYVKG